LFNEFVRVQKNIRHRLMKQEQLSKLDKITQKELIVPKERPSSPEPNLATQEFVKDELFSLKLEIKGVSADLREEFESKLHHL